MSYENPEVPHEVNVGRENPLHEFLRLAAGLALVIVVLSAVLYFAGGWLARLVPFETERGWVGSNVVGVTLEAPAGDDAKQVERYVEDLTQRLAARMDLPADMQIRAHYADMGVPNAFATLGGHIVITSDLYARMPSENALAAVIAHEIAHVKHRDPISAVGGAATLAVLLVVFGRDANTLAPALATVVQRGYSRGAEERADEASVAALRAEYGHAGGAAAVFEVLSEYREEKRRQDLPSILSTHPADEDRIRRLKAAAADWDPEQQPLRPLAVVSAAEKNGARD